eukprot:6477631-Amphidinium_carterae.1
MFENGTGDRHHDKDFDGKFRHLLWDLFNLDRLHEWATPVEANGEVLIFSTLKKERRRQCPRLWAGK